MKRLILGVLIIGTLILLASSSVSATKPGEDTNPNGFPAGIHFNLNIIGKKADFNGCELSTDPDTGEIIYGNVIFVPENGKNIEILMQSGKGKRAGEILELRVTDPCAGFDHDAAVLELPKNERGYDVYARALAKPTMDPNMTVAPELVSVIEEDDDGNVVADLIYLGFVTPDGIYPFGLDEVTLTRSKGKSRALDITGLFKWSGNVCYFNPEGYCFDDCSTTNKCCVDTDGDGLYDSCIDPDLELGCGEGSFEETIYCKTYTDEWVFNIADFVEYLWDINNNGAKLINVRFYPR